MITRSMAAETAPQLADAMLLERGTDRCPLLVGVVPLKTTRPLALPWNSPSAIVLVADPEASDRGASGLLRALYALTSREESVVRLIAKGCGTKVAARTLGIAPSTVRTHLHQVFAKTGVKCQAELASLVQRLE